MAFVRPIAKSVEYVGHHGFAVTIYIDDLPAEALAFASITQIDTSGQPILGSAITTVNNVVPQVGSVTVRGEINWQFDLHVRVSVLAIPPDYRFGQSA